MKNKAPKKKKKLGTFLVELLRDAFLGGNEYNTIRGERSPFPVALIIGVITTTALFLALIFSSIQASELSTDIAKIRVQLVSVSAKADTLEGEFSRKYPFSEIQAYAEEHGLSADGGRIVILPDETEEENTEDEKESSDSLMSIVASVFKKLGELFK